MNAGRPIPLWPGRPRPLPGETVSSWLSRTAWSNGLTPAELYGVATSGAQIHSRDLDRLAERSLLIRLSAATGISADILADAMVTRWAGHLYDAEERHIRLPWLPSVGTERTRPSFGQQFCPLCLAEDAAPYFRLGWRLYFVTACRRHRLYLCDRCSGCGEPIQPLKTIRTKTDLECHKCGTSLMGARTGSINDLSTQTMLLTATAQDEVNILGHGPIRQPLFFELALRLLRLVAGGSFARSLRTELAENVDELSQLGAIPIRADPYQFEPRQRHLLLTLAARMLDDWPRRFHAACEAAGVSRWQLERASRSPMTLLKKNHHGNKHQPNIAMISPN